MNAPTIEQQLISVEHQLDEVVEHLGAGDAQALVQVSAGLQATAVGLVQLLQTSKTIRVLPEQRHKMGQLAQRLLFLRESLLRRTAYVERALQVIMPTVEKTTYFTPGPYAKTTRSAGAVHTFTA